VSLHSGSFLFQNAHPEVDIFCDNDSDCLRDFCGSVGETALAGVSQIQSAGNLNAACSRCLSSSSRVLVVEKFSRRSDAVSIVVRKIAISAMSISYPRRSAEI
jgi:hypothetical protein